jgi:hypothetical protein
MQGQELCCSELKYASWLYNQLCDLGASLISCRAPACSQTMAEWFYVRMMGVEGSSRAHGHTNSDVDAKSGLL